MSLITEGEDEELEDEGEQEIIMQFLRTKWL